MLKGGSSAGTGALIKIDENNGGFQIQICFGTKQSNRC